MCLVSLLVLVVGWSALWVFARQQALQSFAGWLGSERAHGRLWTCPDRRIGGFPLGIELSCAEPTFKGPLADGIYSGSVARVTAGAQLYFPTHVVVDLAGPLLLQNVGGGPSIRVDWSKALVTLRGDVPGDLDRGQVEITQAVVALPGEDAARPVRIGRLEAGFRPMLQTPAQPVDAETSFTMSDGQVPDADAAFGSTDSISASLTGTITRFGGTGPTIPQLLEPWREAGGQFRVKSFAFRKGDFRADGDGRLELDEDRRLQGRLETRFSGLEPVAKRFGIPTGAVALGGVLSNLLGGKGTSSGLGQPELALPLIAKEGRLWIGPVKTGIKLDPLY